MPPKKRATAGDDSLDPSAMKVADLKEELEKRGLETTGKKAELLARLEDALKSGPSRRKKIKAETADSAVVDYSKMKLADLRKELESQGLDTSGKKAELIARLEGVSSKEKKAAGKGTKKKPKVETKEEDEVPEDVPKAEEMEETDFSKARRALASSAGPSKKGPTKHKVDSLYSVYGGFGSLSVLEDWDCMLNQTNIGHNNNKYYIIQLLQRGSRYILHTRWGRVGEPGQQASKDYSDMDAGVKDFKKKFTDKTKNKWENRANFEPAPGKYTLLEMDDDDDGADEAMATKLAALDEPDFGVLPVVKKVLPCTLNQPTQKFLELIFNMDMFNHAMKDLEIDTKKMPLGKLSKVQIAKGFEALEAVERALDACAPRSEVAELTSKFYTCIPHDFGRRTPPPLDDKEKLQKKFDMLMILGDIELAQGLKKDQDKKKLEVRDVNEVPHQLDVQYESLKANLTLLEATSHEHQVIVKYMKATEPKWRNLKLQHVWRVHRYNVEERYTEHDALTNRRLLWHGTNVAVVAAILKSGLRIMPHSGGRVGRGIYLASENSKSAGYVRCSANNTGIMFLNEAALGKEKIITVDDHTLTTPPKGYDSVLAKGMNEPDPSADITLTLDGKPVQVPQGSPTPTSYSSSNFSQSEYLVYKESQTCIRYMLQIKFA